MIKTTWLVPLSFIISISVITQQKPLLPNDDAEQVIDTSISEKSK